MKRLPLSLLTLVGSVALGFGQAVEWTTELVRPTSRVGDSTPTIRLLDDGRFLSIFEVGPTAFVTVLKGDGTLQRQWKVPLESFKGVWVVAQSIPGSLDLLLAVGRLNRTTLTRWRNTTGAAIWSFETNGWPLRLFTDGTQAYLAGNADSTSFLPSGTLGAWRLSDGALSWSRTEGLANQYRDAAFRASAGQLVTLTESPYGFEIRSTTDGSRVAFVAPGSYSPSLTPSGRLMVSSGNRLGPLNEATGEPLWSAEYAALAELPGGDFVGFKNSTLSRLDGTTGQTKWETLIPALGNRVGLLTRRPGVIGLVGSAWADSVTKVASVDAVTGQLGTVVVPPDALKVGGTEVGPLGSAPSLTASAVSGEVHQVALDGSGSRQTADLKPLVRAPLDETRWQWATGLGGTMLYRFSTDYSKSILGRIWSDGTRGWQREHELPAESSQTLREFPGGEIYLLDHVINRFRSSDGALGSTMYVPGRATVSSRRLFGVFDSGKPNVVSAFDPETKTFLWSRNVGGSSSATVDGENGLVRKFETRYQRLSPISGNSAASYFDLADIPRLVTSDNRVVSVRDLRPWIEPDRAFLSVYKASGDRLWYRPSLPNGRQFNRIWEVAAVGPLIVVLASMRDDFTLNLIAFHRDTGALRWQLPLGGTSLWGPPKHALVVDSFGKLWAFANLRTGFRMETLEVYEGGSIRVVRVDPTLGTVLSTSTIGGAEEGFAVLKGAALGTDGKVAINYLQFEPYGHWNYPRPFFRKYGLN